MQPKSKNNAKPEVVVKPILRGRWNAAETWKLAPKRFLSMLLVAVAFIFFSVMAGVDQPALRIIISAAIVLLMFYFQCTKGMEAGEKDAAFSEIMYEREQEGRPVSDADRARCFHPLRGFAATLLGILPFVLLCLVYAFLAKRWEYQLGVLPSWTDHLRMHNETGDALAYYSATNTMAVADWLRIIVRCLVMPYINIAGTFGNDAVLWAERLSPLLVTIVPLGFGVGYAMGQSLRTRINTGIKQGVEKKKRKEMKARKKRQRSSTPERLI